MAVMRTYQDRWEEYVGRLEENGRPLSDDEAFAHFEESGGVIVVDVEVLPPWVVFDR